MDCVCISCDRAYEYVRSKGHTKKRCNSCLVNQRRFDLKKKAVDYKGGQCHNCGYKKCFRSMTFHHADSSVKEFTISGSHARSWKEIAKELDKCTLLCSNCHGELHCEGRCFLCEP